MTFYNYVKCGYIGMSKTSLCTCRGGHMRFYMAGIRQNRVRWFLMSIADDMLHFERNIVNDLIFYTCNF